MSVIKTTKPNVRLLYFTDPMCSWCWGFSPVIAELQQQAQSLPLEVIAGGLRGANTPPMTADMREKIHGHWHHVQQLTGQPFQFAGSLPDNFIYNSEPACRALVTVREIAPLQLLPWLHRLQQAFYAEAIDITQTSELSQLAEAFGLADFLPAFESEAMRAATEDDFDRRHESAVTGFPSLLLQREGRLKVIAHGYASLAELQQRLTALL